MPDRISEAASSQTRALSFRASGGQTDARSPPISSLHPVRKGVGRAQMFRKGEAPPDPSPGHPRRHGSRAGPGLVQDSLVATSGSASPGMVNGLTVANWRWESHCSESAAGVAPALDARPSPLPALRPARWTDVGLFVGLFCQPTSGSGRFVAVNSPTTKSAKSPASTGTSCKTEDAGGGTRTPDTRIMIPLL